MHNIKIDKQALTSSNICSLDASGFVWLNLYWQKLGKLIMKCMKTKLSR